MSRDDNLIRDLDKAAETDGFSEEHKSLLLEASERLDDLVDEVGDLEDQISDLQNREDAAAFDEEEAQRLYEAIAERRTQDAIDILQRHTGYMIRLMPAAIYADLFPSRVSR